MFVCVRHTGLAWLSEMHCDRLLFVSGHKSNSFHSADDFFLLLAALLQCNSYYMLSIHTSFFLSRSVSTHIHLHKYPACIIILFYLFNFYRHLGCDACTNLSFSLSLRSSSALVLSRAACVCVYATYHLPDGDANAILEWEFYRLCEKGIAKSIFVLIVCVVLRTEMREEQKGKNDRAIEREGKIVERIL